MKTVIGTFESVRSAERVREDLLAAGFRNLDLLQPGGGKTLALERYGVPNNRLSVLQDAWSRGECLLVVRCDRSRVDEAIRILEHNGRYDMSGWRDEDIGVGAQTGALGATGLGQDVDRRDLGRDKLDAGEKIPIIEEELAVGKREKVTGGARISTHAESKQVEVPVELREEHVDVQRTKVDRPATEAEISQAFTDRVIEVEETNEVPVVAKEARVVEEIDVRKDVSHRTETVRDTITRTAVDVDQLAGHDVDDDLSYQGVDYETGWRKHFQSDLSMEGGRYEDFRDHYRLGHTLASSGTYNDWYTAEPEARRRYLATGGKENLWYRVSRAIRHAFEGHGTARRPHI